MVQRGTDDTYWLWTISLWLTTLTSQFDYALKNRDEGTLSDALSQYARLVIRGLRMCLDSNVILDLHPNNFGLLCEEAFYLRDELERGDQMPLAGHAMLRRLDEFSAFPGALRVYVEVLLHELALHITLDEADRLNLAHAVKKVIVSSDAGKRAKAHLSSALARPRKAAR